MLDKVQEAREHRDKKEAYFHPGSKEISSCGRYMNEARIKNAHFPYEKMLRKGRE